MSLSIKKVLISEPVDPGCARILSENGVEVTTKVGLSKDELIGEIKVSISFKFPNNNAFLKNIPVLNVLKL